MTLEIEGIVDRGVGGNEALGLALGLEALHLSLSPSDCGAACKIDPHIGVIGERAS